MKIAQLRGRIRFRACVRRSPFGRGWLEKLRACRAVIAWGFWKYLFGVFCFYFIEGLSRTLFILVINFVGKEKWDEIHKSLFVIFSTFKHDLRIFPLFWLIVSVRGAGPWKKLEMRLWKSKIHPHSYSDFPRQNHYRSPPNSAFFEITRSWNKSKLKKKLSKQIENSSKAKREMRQFYRVSERKTWKARGWKDAWN